MHRDDLHVQNRPCAALPGKKRPARPVKAFARLTALAHMTAMEFLPRSNNSVQQRPMRRWCVSIANPFLFRNRKVESLLLLVLISNLMTACSPRHSLADDEVYKLCKEAVEKEALWDHGIIRLSKVPAKQLKNTPSNEIHFVWSRGASTLSAASTPKDARKRIESAHCVFDTTKQRVTSVNVSTRGSFIQGNRF